MYHLSIFAKIECCKSAEDSRRTIGSFLLVSFSFSQEGFGFYRISVTSALANLLGVCIGSAMEALGRFSILG